MNYNSEQEILSTDSNVCCYSICSRNTRTNLAWTFQVLESSMFQDKATSFRFFVFGFFFFFSPKIIAVSIIFNIVWSSVNMVKLEI